MRLRVVLSLVAAAWTLAGRADEAPPAPRVAPQSVDPDIQAVVASVSDERIQRSVYVLASFRTRHTLSDPLPSGDGIGGAASWIRAEFDRVAQDSGGRLRVESDTFNQLARPPDIPQPVAITNLVATLPGSAGRPGEEADDRVLVISAHYDSRVADPLDAASPAPGANDDASGVAAVLELARVMAHARTRATVVFLVAAGGEQGQVGAAHWAAKARARNLAIAAAFDDDCIGLARSADGTVRRNSVRLFAPGLWPDASSADLARDGGENDTPARELARFVRDCAAAYVPSMSVGIAYRPDGRPGVGGHRPFIGQGYPGLRFTEDAEDARRLAEGDGADTVDFAYAADVARVNAAALLALARAPAPPSGAAADATDPAGDAAVRWAPDPEAGVAGYRVVWRASTSPFWEHALDVPGGGSSRAVLRGVSRDTGVFGVEAVNAAGQAGPAAFAGGGRGP